LLSRISQTWTKSERQFCEVIFARTLIDDGHGQVNAFGKPAGALGAAGIRFGWPIADWRCH